MLLNGGEQWKKFSRKSAERLGNNEKAIPALNAAKLL